MEDTRNEYRNPMKKLYKKYGIHRAIRSDTLNDLIDEVNAYYKKKETPVDKTVKELKEFHEKDLKQQLDGWVKYLEAEKDKLPKGDSDYHKGVKNGFAKVIEKLKDVVTK